MGRAMSAEREKGRKVSKHNEGEREFSPKKPPSKGEKTYDISNGKGKEKGKRESFLFLKRVISGKREF